MCFGVPKKNLGGSDPSGPERASYRGRTTIAAGAAAAKVLYTSVPGSVCNRKKDLTCDM